MTPPPFEIDWYLSVLSENEQTATLCIGNSKLTEEEYDQAMMEAKAQIIARYPLFEMRVVNADTIELTLPEGSTLDDWYQVRGMLNSAFPAYYVNVLSAANLCAITGRLTLEERLRWIRLLASP